LVNDHDADAKKLAELGYKQEFDRKWSGFHNFAISFSIISILSGCFTTFGQAWNNGGPIAISIGWPIIAALILIIGLCMAELVSAMPTAGGIYYWAFKLGKPIHGWMTGWLNLVGLIAVTAAVDYGFATFFVTTANLFSDFWDPTNLTQVFLVFLVTIILHILMNVRGAKIIHTLQTVNVWWHVFGVTAIIAILAFIPTKHQTINWVFTTQINNSGFSADAYWFYVLPLGIWKSIAYSAVAGWILLLAFLFAATDVDAINEAFGFSPVIFLTSLPLAWAKVLLIITCVGQFFCGMSCVTAGSRMLFAFSRDRAVPGHKYWTKLDKNRNPSNAAIGLGTAGAILTLPALWAPEGTVVPVAFFAVTSVAVIGLFGGFAIPIWLRFKAGSSFKVGEWNLGNKYKWMAPLAVAEILIISVYFCLPTTPAGVWGSKDFSWLSAQYAPIALFVVVGGAYLWWHLGAKKSFKGPIKTINN
jgi:amino acid transporter